MAELDPQITRKNIPNRGVAIAAAMAISYFGYVSIHDQFNDIVRSDFSEQYLDEGQCMAKSPYAGGDIAVSGFLESGETTVTVGADLYSTVKFKTPTMVFIAGEEGYIPVSPAAVAAVNKYHCPPGAP